MGEKSTHSIVLKINEERLEIAQEITEYSTYKAMSVFSIP